MAKTKQSSNKGHLINTLAEKFSSYEIGCYFPSDDVDPSEKGNDWCLAWQQALWGLFLRGGCYNTLFDYQDLQLLRLYGAGRQPNGIYMDLLLMPNDINPTRAGWLSTNWEIFSPAPKLHREVRGRFEKQEYDYVATAVDPTSQTEKEEKKWETWYDSQFGKMEAELMQKVQGEVEEKIKYIAQSLEELELFQEMGGFKLKKEAELETVLDMTDYLSDIKTVKQKFIDDLVDWNKAAFRDYYDPVSGLVKYEYVDWENLIIDFSNETDFKDIRFWSYIKFETINSIRMKTGMSEHELIEIAKLNVGWWGNLSWNVFNRYRAYGYRTDKGVRTYDQFRVPVLVSEWLSTDTYYKKVKKNKAGVEKEYDQEWGKEYNTANSRTKKTPITNVYQSSWIMGSQYVFDNGISLNTARPNPKNPRLSIHAINIPGKSITESIKPCLDQIELAWVRFQSAIAQAPPAGMDFDLSMLEDISVDGGQTLSVMELIMLKRQTGDTLRRSKPLDNPRMMNQGKAINRNEGGVGGFLTEILSTLDINFRYIYELTGIDLVSAASAQNADMTATQVKYASAATSDALQPLYTAWVQAKEDAAITASCKIQRALVKHPEAYEAYYSMLGRTGTEVLKIGQELSAAQLGIKLEVKPTQQMRQAAIEAATKALQPGKNGENINLPDWWYFVDMIERGRASHAMAVLNYRLQRSKKEALKLQQENMQLNGQNAQQLQQTKNQGEMMKIQAEGEMDMKEEAVKALLQMKVDDNAALSEIKKDLIMQILGGTTASADTSAAAPPVPQAPEPVESAA